jgi:HPt (histidine-containing phosphotransfer) domain-containing protein
MSRRRNRLLYKKNAVAVEHDTVDHIDAVAAEKAAPEIQGEVSREAVSEDHALPGNAVIAGYRHLAEGQVFVGDESPRLYPNPNRSVGRERGQGSRLWLWHYCH